MKTRAISVKSTTAMGFAFGLLLLGSGESRAGLAAPYAPQGLRSQWHFAEGAGTVAGDSSGNGFAATLSNGVAWSPGRIGTAVNFDGVNDFVNLGSDLSILNSVPATTVSCWIKPGSTLASGSFRELVSLSVGSTSATNTSRIAVSLQGDGTAGDIFVGGRSTDTEAQKNVIANASLSVGTWHHVVAVLDFTGNSIKVYVNGTLSATNAAAGFASATTPSTSSRSCALGAQDTGDSNYYHGLMDEVQVYNRALSAAEIATLASGDARAAHWAFDEGAGASASDSSGDNYGGTLTNGLTWTSAGQMSAALRFDGSNDFVNLGSDLGILRNVNATTVTAWIKPASTMAPNTYREIVSISVNNGATPTNTSRVALSLKGDGSAGGLYLGGRSTDTEAQKVLTVDANLQANQWYHVAGVIDFASGSLTIYLNGLRVATSTVAFAQTHTPNTVSTSAALGAQDTGNANYFHGDMDDVRIYSRPLCACEIQTLVGQDALRAHYMFDEGTGTTAADSSGNGFTGTLTNGPTWATGQIGGALQFDGTNDYLNLGTNLSMLRNVPAATVAGWVRMTSLPASGAYRELVSISVGNATPTNTSRIALSLVGDGTAADVFVGGRSTDTEAQKNLTANANLAANTWYHVAATIDFQNNSIKIYKDGVLSASATVAFSSPFTADTASACAALASQDTGDSNFFAGLLDDVRVYCRVLSAVEIQSLSSVIPATPTGLAATPGDQQVTLTWNAASGAVSYEVKRSTTSGGPYITVGMPNGTTFTDTGLVNGTTYFYVVAAENVNGQSANSAEISATPSAPPSPPNPPTGFAAAAGDQKVDLTWNASAGATSYNVKRSTTSGSGYVFVANVTATSFSNTGLANGTTYYFVVTALNSVGESGNSGEASATPAAPPSPPPAPTALTSIPGDSQVELAWNASATATSYKVKRSTTSGSGYLDSGTTTDTTFTVTGLTNNTVYYFVVTALNAAGESGNSAEVSARPNIPGGQPTSLTATAGNYSVTLDWADSTDPNLVGYNVYRALTQTGPYGLAQRVNTSTVTVSSYLDQGLESGTTYYFVVRALNNAAQESGNSNEAFATPTGIQSPTGLSATGTGVGIQLNWNAVSGAAKYIVYRSTTPGGPHDFLEHAPTTSLLDTNVRVSTTYYYVVRASTTIGNVSAPSSEASATPPVPGQASVLFIVGTSPIPSGTGDSAIKSRVESLGYSVVVKPGTGSGAATTGDAAGKALILISATAPSSVGSTFASVAVPILTWSVDSFSGLGMTDSTPQVYFGTVTGQSQLSVFNDNDPIIRGIASLSQPVTVLTGTTTDTFNWASPGGFATIGATQQGDQGKAFVFSYEANTNMPGLSNVPARRVGLFLAANTASNLNDNGWNVVESAIRWCAGAPERIEGLWVSVADGQITVHWGVSSGATSYTVRMGTSAGSMSIIATGVSGTSFTVGQLTNGTTYFLSVTAANASGESAASATIQGQPEPKAVAIAIKGGTYLRRKKPEHQEDIFNTRTYTALVQRNNVDVVVTDLVADNPDAAAGQAWSITGPATILEQTLTTCKIQAQNAAGKAILTYKVKIRIGELIPSGVTVYDIVPAIKCEVRVDLKLLVALKFHFPNDSDEKRTQRAGYPNLFANPNDPENTVRRDERIKLAVDLIDGIGQNKSLAHVWSQAGIDFYPKSNVNNSMDTIIGGGEGVWDGDVFLAEFGKAVSPGMERLQVMNDPANNPSALNVYLVRSIKDFGGYCVSKYTEPGNPAIVIEDEVTPQNNNTLAHEIGHALALPHANVPNSSFFNPIEGTINNLWPLFGQNSTVQYLMHTSAAGTLLTEFESIYTYGIAGRAKQGNGNIVGARE